MVVGWVSSALRVVIHFMQVATTLYLSLRSNLLNIRQFFARPLAESSVQAGMPVSVSATEGEYFVIDDMLIDRPSETTLIPVKGDSMIEAGIRDGDIAVVEKRNLANVGDIVVAIVDNEFTLKTLDKERGKYILRPANPAYPVIRPQGTLEIFGVLIGLIRKYRK